MQDKDLEPVVHNQALIEAFIIPSSGRTLFSEGLVALVVVRPNF